MRNSCFQRKIKGYKYISALLQCVLSGHDSGTHMALFYLAILLSSCVNKQQQKVFDLQLDVNFALWLARCPQQLIRYLAAVSRCSCISQVMSCLAGSEVGPSLFAILECCILFVIIAYPHYCTILPSLATYRILNALYTTALASLHYVIQLTEV